MVLGDQAPPMHQDIPERDHKRPRIEEGAEPAASILQRLLFGHGSRPGQLPRLPDTVDDRHEQLAKYFKAAGLRTSLISSPQPAVSVFLDARQSPSSPAYEGVWAMLGLHPRQLELESAFISQGFRDRVRRASFARRMLEHLPSSTLDAPGVRAMLTQLQHEAVSEGEAPVVTFEASLAAVVSCLCAADRAQQPEALEKEAHRVCWRFSSLSNALLQSLIDRTGLTLADAVYRHSPVPYTSRLTLLPYVPTEGGRHPGPFIFLPGLATLLAHGVEGLVAHMVEALWSHVWRCGYYPGAGPSFRGAIGEQLGAYFTSGLARPGGRVALRAGFEPTHFFSLYLHGVAGCGKSSFVGKLVPALHATIEAFLDPQMDVRFVKQALNKRYLELDRELTLRPNNNDRSVMSIIQGRRMTLASTKPGLVVVGLEEVPPPREEGGGEEEEPGEEDIEQISSLRLLCNRFSGMVGEASTLSEASRARLLRQNRGGISDHSTLLPIFTSNYPLHPTARALLHSLPLFSHLLTLHVTPIEGQERRALALGFLTQAMQEATAKRGLCLGQVTLDVQLDQGDIRDLVRRLRVLCFFASQALPLLCPPHPVHLTITPSHCPSSPPSLDLHVTSSSSPPSSPPFIQLTGLLEHLLLPVSRPPMDDRTLLVLSSLSPCPLLSSYRGVLGHVLDYYFNDVLCPAVLLCDDEEMLTSLVDAMMQALPGLKAVRGVDASCDRIVKSLYDGPEVRCLRDDLRALRRLDPLARIVIQMKATTLDAQLRVREMLEDSPSMVACSTARSALQKHGLFFALHVHTHAITPELRSRASALLLQTE